MSADMSKCPGNVKQLTTVRHGDSAGDPISFDLRSRPTKSTGGKVIARFALIRLDKRKRAARDRRLDEHLLVAAVGAVKAQLAPKQFSQQGHVDVGGRFVALRVALSATG